jgi:two-component system, sensor histidine kinase
MTAGVATDRRAVPRRAWMGWLATALVLVLVAIAYVQWRQFKLLDTASHFQNDALGWSFSQLETEQLRLRNEMQSHLDDPAAHGLAAVRLRYDIFVSRVGLVDHERAARIMAQQAGYGPAVAKVQAFVREADQWLGEKPSMPLTRSAVVHLLPMLDELGVPLHDLSLGASHLLYQRATERNNAVRQQAQMGIALTAFQCLLMFALAFIVLRQFRSLRERRRALEALADTLGTARREADAANRAKSVFLANMSHEIRTPFHGMLGMMSLLQDSRLAPRQQDLLSTARESAEHLLDILNDILDLSQLESGKLQVLPATIDLLQLVAQVEALMRAQAQAKGLVLDVHMAPNVPRWVRADATRLKQILFNLLSNGLKFTRVGTVDLAVTCRGDGALLFTVTDSGIGMDDATLARLFQRFMQGDDTPSRHTHGTGLGLQITRELAQLMGGDVAVRSEPGVGSAFSVWLPLPAVAPPSAPATEAGMPAAAATRRLHVLVAEDHPVNRAYMEAVLDKLGHSAVFAPDGATAVQAVQAATEGFDVVLMDLHMPGMDGFAATRAIRALPPPRGTVPIVALTADAFHESRHLALQSGMNGFITKPAHLPQLRDALARYSAAEPAVSGAAGGTKTGEPAMPSAFTSTLTSAATSAAPISEGGLDLATIADVRQSLSAEQFSNLLAGFFNEQARLLPAVRASAANVASSSARADLRAFAHALKGASASLGLQGVATLAAQLQSSPVEAPSDALLEQLAAIERELGTVREHCLRRGLLTP